MSKHDTDKKETASVLRPAAGSERLAIKAVVDQVLELVQTKCEWVFDEPMDYISDGKGDFKRPATWQEKELRSALLDIERILQNEKVDKYFQLASDRIHSHNK